MCEIFFDFVYMLPREREIFLRWFAPSLFFCAYFALAITMPIKLVITRDHTYAKTVPIKFVITSKRLCHATE